MEISKDNYPYNRKFILTFLLCKILKEEEKMFKNTKGQEKGITLIALVITIIVLLILARNFDFNAEPEIIRFLTKQDKQEI